ncbi:MAG: sulfatase [Chloroflexi bacterium]|nr:sulfatase [Chloroflexota bacterium]
MTQPDILFIVLDTQRADRLGCYGYQRPTSPNLDQFADRAVVFEQAIAPAQWTIPSHASMFTGLYPTAHQVTQSNQMLGADVPHLVETLGKMGYETVGFCNNPLVGVLDNGFQRGFEQFYVYGGAFPERPHFRRASKWSTLREQGQRLLHRIAHPIQNFFGRSELAFSISLHAWLTPLWANFINFKGQNERSVGDLVHYLERRDANTAETEQPLFLFLNLMETHLPFYPPQRFVDQMAPYMREDTAARHAQAQWNKEAYRWAAPLPDGLNETEARVLSDLYDAEVAYQDSYLGRLLDYLRQRPNADNTLTIIVGDHGDSLGEHNYFGHAFTAYQELIHVPLIMDWPAQFEPGERIATPVSTRRVFHTMISAAGRLPAENTLSSTEVRALSLAEVVRGRDVEAGTAYAEIYPPLNFVRAIEHRTPGLIEQFRCLDMRRAIVRDNLKLIQLDDDPDELFDLAQDTLELDNLISQRPADKATLNQQLNRHIDLIEAQRATLLAGATLELGENPELLQRLRGLGYIE